MHIPIGFGDYFDNNESHLSCGKHNLFQLLFQSSIQREQGCDFWETLQSQIKWTEPNQKVPGANIFVSRPCTERWNRTLLFCSALFKDWIILWQAKWSDPQIASLSILPSQLLELLLTASMPFIMLSSLTSQVLNTSSAADTHESAHPHPSCSACSALFPVLFL